MAVHRMALAATLIWAFGAIACTPDGTGSGDEAAFDSGGMGHDDASSQGGVDGGSANDAEAGSSIGADSGSLVAADSGLGENTDSGSGTLLDAGPDAPSDAGPDAPSDAGPIAPSDAGPVVPPDAGPIVLPDAGPIAPSDAGSNEPTDSGSTMPTDAGPMPALDSGTPTGLDGGQIISMALGGQHSCVVRAGGEIFCWGKGRAGQLGVGSYPFTQSTPAPLATPINAVQVSAGYQFTCAVDANNSQWCWGANSSGQLGLGHETTQHSPQQGIGVSSIGPNAMGHWHGCAQLPDNTASCWGWNNRGQLGNGVVGDGAGDGGQMPYPNPAPVLGLTDVQQVALGHFHSCAMLGNGTVYCWGYNGWGEIGNGDFGGTTPVPSPALVVNLNDAVQIAAGDQFTCARRAGDTLACWGKNGAGQYGNANESTSPSPTDVTTIDNVKDMALGRRHACAIRGDRTLWCWGDNAEGQVGDGSGIDQNAPQHILDDVEHVALGDFHSCAARTDGSVWCWGLGDDGRLGQGEVTSSDVPVQVVFP